MSTTLTDLLERHFLPQVMPDIGADYEGSFRIAIKWLSATVGQPPTLADATPANITAMQHAMADAGMGWSRIRQLKIRIGSLCKHAYRLGLVDHFESVPTIKVVSDSPAYGPFGKKCRIRYLKSSAMQHRKKMPRMSAGRFAIECNFRRASCFSSLLFFAW